MEILTKEIIQELLTIEQGPCLSIYMPAHRNHPENLKDPIRFKNLPKQLEESLLQKYSADVLKKHLEPLEALVDDESLRNHASNGLAFFSATGVFKIVGLPLVVDELAMVAHSFHTQKLMTCLTTWESW